MYQISKVHKFKELALYDITDVSDEDIILKNIELIRMGRNEGAFSYIPNMSLESVLDYRKMMKIITMCHYRVHALFNNKMDIVGFIDFGSISEKGFIIGIIVKPEYRRIGLGSLLLKSAESVLKNWGVRMIETTIFSTNTVSKKFFARNGYFYSGIYKEHINGCSKNGKVEEIWWKYIV
ncbi:MAG: GNAT family N-acetyltransferase [Candidatus Methanomethylicia archaeon]